MKRILEADELPFMPMGMRIIVKKDPPQMTSTAGLHIPGNLIQNFGQNSGVILAAGLEALDAMHDRKIRIGDRILHGQYAGIVEEWDRVAVPGSDPTCDHSRWEMLSATTGEPPKWECFRCKAQRWKEPLIVVHFDDVLGCADLATRVHAGAVKVTRGATEAGTTQHFYEETAQ